MSYKHDTMPGLIPYLTVGDADKSVDFYQKAFGFRLIAEPGRDDSGKIIHAEMGFHDVVIMMAPEGAWGNQKTPKTTGVEAPLTLYVYCEDVDALYRQAVNNGATAVSEPEECFWGDRMCALVDLDGYSWSFATKSPDAPVR